MSTHATSFDASQMSLLATEPSHPPRPVGRLRILTWNVQHASPARAQRQAAWLASQEAEVLVLTEVAGTGGGDALVKALSGHGFRTYTPPGAGSDYRVVTAGRGVEYETVPAVRTSHLPHRCAAARLRIGGSATEAGMVGLYVPSRGPRQRRNVDKRAFQAAVTEMLPTLADQLAVSGPVIIAGDLNVVEPGHQPHHAVFGAWEYDFYRAFADAGYNDAYRRHHPETVEHSWYGRRSGAGYRFDHIFAAPIETVTDCRYLHQPRREGLSDHAAMVATLTIPEHVT